MNIQYYINLDNEYDFKAHCAKKSIEAFEMTIRQKYAPSRFSLLTLLVNEVILTPFYLAKKASEIANTVVDTVQGKSF